MSDKLFSVSPSGLVEYFTCSMKHNLSRRHRLRAVGTSIHLVFGSALHECVETYCQTGEVPDDLFVDLFNQHKGDRELLVPKTWTEEEMLATGEALARQIKPKFEELGLYPVFLKDGELGSEIDLGYIVDDKVWLHAILDLIVQDEQGRLFILDVKAVSAPSSEEFWRLSDQITIQQAVFMRNAERLGLDGSKLAGVGFWEAIKKKIPKRNGEGPVFRSPVIAPLRNDDDIRAIEKKALFMRQCVDSEMFFKNAGMAFNSPCNMCDFKGYCAFDSTEGLFVEPEYERSAS